MPEVAEDYTSCLFVDKTIFMGTLFDHPHEILGDENTYTFHAEMQERMSKEQPDVLFVFDVSRRATLDSIKAVWLPLVQAVCPHAPFMLAGLKVIPLRLISLWCWQVHPDLLLLFSDETIFHQPV